MKKYIILASRSRKRSQTLSSCGIRYKIFKTNIREHIQQGKNIPRQVMQNAKNKATYTAKFYKNNIILGADTLTLLKGKIIGKPKNRDKSRYYL